METGLLIRIGAETLEFDRKLSQLEAKVATFASRLGNVVKTDSFDKLKASVESFKQSVESIKPVHVPVDTNVAPIEIKVKQPPPVEVEVVTDGSPLVIPPIPPQQVTLEGEPVIVPPIDEKIVPLLAGDLEVPTPEPEVVPLVADGKPLDIAPIETQIVPLKADPIHVEPIPPQEVPIEPIDPIVVPPIPPQKVEVEVDKLNWQIEPPPPVEIPVKVEAPIIPPVEVIVSTDDAQQAVNNLGDRTEALRDKLTRLRDALSAPDLHVDEFKRLREEIERTEFAISRGLGANKSLAQLDAQLKRFQLGLKDATNPESIGRLNRAIDVTSQKMTSLKNLGVEKSIGAIAPQSDRAGQALQNLSRVAQDAPFGFIGISNNINPLLESFQRLRASAPSTGAALKQLAGSMLGAGGLGLAVGLISSALVLYERGMFKAKDAAQRLREEQEKLTKESEDYVESLDRVNKARLKGEQDAQKELISLKTLYEATQNANIPLGERRKLVDELQKQYPAYFANIKDEAILAGNAKTEYEKLATAILAASKARAAEAELDALTKKERLLNKQNLSELQKEFDLREKIRKEKAELEKPKTATPILPGGVAQSGNVQSQSTGLSTLTALQNQLTTATERTNKKQQEITANLAEQRKISEEIKQIVEATPEAAGGGKVGGVAAVQADVKIKPDKIEVDWGNVERINSVNIEDLEAELAKMVRRAKINLPNLPIGEFGLEGLSKAIEGARDKFEREWRTKFAEKDLKFPQIVITDANIGGVDEFLKNLYNFQREAQDIMAAMAEGIAVSLADGLGKAFAGDNFSDIFSGIFNVIGSGLQELGKIMIEASALMEIFRTAFKSMVPGAQLLAGLGLVALGALVKSQASKIPGFAQGGIVPPGFPNDTYLARLTSGERIIPEGHPLGEPERLSDILYRERLVTSISATDLRILLLRDQKNKGGTW